MSSDKNSLNSPVSSDSVQNTTGKRGHPSTSSSSSCDSPNATVLRSTKIFKGHNKSKIPVKQSKDKMGLTEQDLAKIKDLMNSLLDIKLDPLKKHQEAVSRQVARMEKFTREKNIIISGIPEANDDLQNNIQVVNDLCDKAKIDRVLIDDVFLLGKKTSTDRPLLLKLALMVDKKKLMQAAKALRKEKSI